MWQGVPKGRTNRNIRNHCWMDLAKGPLNPASCVFTVTPHKVQGARSLTLPPKRGHFNKPCAFASPGLWQPSLGDPACISTAAHDDASYRALFARSPRCVFLGALLPRPSFLVSFKTGRALTNQDRVARQTSQAVWPIRSHLWVVSGWEKNHAVAICIKE